MSGPSKSYWNMIKTYFGTKNVSALEIMPQNRAMCGYHLGHLVDHPHLIRSAVEEILALYRQGKIKPQIDSVWEFAEVSTVSFHGSAPLGSTAFKSIHSYVLIVCVI
jgi:hypothetical protein